MAIKVPIVSEFNKTGLVQANTALAKFGVTSQRELQKAGAGFGLLAVGAAKAFSALDAGYDAIITGTGASGKALDGLKDSADNVARTVPNSFGEVGQAIADVNTRLGLTGEPLEEMSKKFLDLSRITKTDVATNVRNVARVFGDAGVAAEDQAATLDMLFAATQKTGIGMDRLTTLTVNYGAPLRQLGFELDESIAMLSKWEAEGVNTEAVLGGMKIGLNNLAKAGKDPATAFAELSEKMIAAETDVEAIGLAAEVFGSRAGADMAAAVREGRFEIEDLMASLGDTEGALDDAAEATLSANDHLKILSNQIIVAAAPAVEMLEKVVSTLVKGLGYLPKQVQAVVVILGAVAIASKSARAGMLAFAKSTDVATASAGRSKLAVGKMSKVLGVAAVAYGAYEANQHAANETQKKFIDNVGRLERATGEAAVNGLNLMIASAKVLRDESADEIFTRIAEESLGAAIQLRDSAAGNEEYAATLAQSGLTVAAMTAAIEAEVAAQKKANAATEEGTTIVDENTDATDGLTEAVVKLGNKTKELTKRIEDDIQASKDLRAERKRAADATYDAEDAEDDYFDALENMHDVNADVESSTRDRNKATRDAARATEEMIRKQLEAAGVVVDSERGQRALTKAMTEQAIFMGGTLGNEILAHVGRLNGIPEEKITEIQALLDEGMVEEAKQKMNDELDSVEANPTVVPVGLEAARARIEAILGRTVNLATNTYVPRTSYTPGNASLLAANGAGLSRSGGGGTGNVYNLTVHSLDAQGAGDVIVEALRRWERSNGTEWRNGN